jgi:GT2 family glycosyltransferase/glycosyltransferase involved in cell wall biosynthesis
MAHAHIHQIFYSDETRAMLDPGFIPHDNVGQRPDWAEYWPIRNLLLDQTLDEDAWYGVLSPRFKQKTGLDSTQVFQFVASAPEDTDVVLFPLYFDEGALFENIFLQGAANHPGIWPIFVETAKRLAPGTDLERLAMDSSQTQFCNYFIAKPRFWRHWFSKAEQIFQAAQQGSTTFGAALNTATYHRNVKGYFFKVFVMERVLSLILAAEPQWKVFAYDALKLPSLRFDIDAELRMLDGIKTALRQTDRAEYRTAYETLREGIFLRRLSQTKTLPPDASIINDIRQILKNRELQTSPTSAQLNAQQAQMLTQQAGHAVHLSVLIGQGAGDATSTQNSLEAQLRPANQILNAAQDEAWITALRNAPQAGWTLLLAPGDLLEPDALLLLETSLTQQTSMKDDGSAPLLLYFDHDEREGKNGRTNPYFKPDFNHELLLSYPYTGRALAVRNGWALPLLEAAAGRNDLVNAYRLTLTALRERDKAAFVRLPALLAHLDPQEPTMFCTSSTAWQALAVALAEHVQQTSPGAQVREGPGPGTFHVIHALQRTPKVSIVIPTRDQLPFLSRCVQSLFDKTNYPDFEILIVDNDSQTAEAQAFLAGLETVDPERIRVLRAPGPFNFSRMNNMAVAEARGEFILLLNNDTAAMQPDWLAHMMRHALRQDRDGGVGIVGARLLYPEGTVQHAGVIMGLRGPAEHPCLGLAANAPGYLFRAQVTQEFSAVTAACLLVSKAVYEEVGGLDETTFAVSYNDVDFCLRVGRTGRRVVWTPLATLLHEGSASQKASIENLSQAQKAARFTREQAAMYQRWASIIANDPAYNPNLSLAERGYEYETNPVLCYDKLEHLDRRRVLAFAADGEGCGHYRIIQPMQAMLEAGLCGGGLSPELLSPNMVLRSGADTLILQRPVHDVALNMLESLLQIQGVRKIFEVDDNMTRLPIKSAHYAHMPKDIRSRLNKAIARCDRLVVSTQALAHEMRGLCDDTRVIMNRLPTAMWGSKPPERPSATSEQRKPRIGWAGGVGHLGDLEMIADVVRDLSDKVEWVFFGMCPDKLRPYVHEVVKGVPTLEYPQKLMELTRSWDMAIAPLEIHVFNECKSNLKLLEYGWCGLPVVCSDITLPGRRPGRSARHPRQEPLQGLERRHSRPRQRPGCQPQARFDPAAKNRHGLDAHRPESGSLV